MGDLPESIESGERQWLLAAINSIPDDLFFVDVEGRVVFVNEAVRSSLGVSNPAELQRRLADVQAMFEVYWPDGRPRLVEESPVRQALRGEVARGEELVRNRATGELRSRVYQVAPVRLRDEVVGAVSLVRDVTELKRAEASLRLAQQRLQTVVDHSRDGINLLDLATGRYTFMSPAQIALTGFTAEELAGMSAEAAFERVHPDDRELSVLQQRAVAEGRDLERTAEYRWRVKSGEYRWFSDSRKLVRDEEGRPVALVGVSRDITDRKRMEDELRTSEARFRTLADGTPVMIWCTDPAGRVLFVNRAYCEFFGVTQEGVRTSGWQVLVHPEDAPRYQEAFAAAIAGRAPFHAEARVRRAGGAWRWIESFAEPQFDAGGELVSMTGSSWDVTDRRRAEDALHQSDRQKTEFLAVLSHELRNPLAAIQNAIALLDQAPPERGPGTRAMDVLRRQAGQLARLVDDLLDLSRITHGKLRVELARADARELVRRAHADAKVLFDERGIELVLDDAEGPLWIEADAPRFGQMLGNLLHNAMKFSGPGGLVRLGVSRQGSTCEISVRDAGPGLRAEDLERIFDAFAQGPTAPGQPGGLGLGLALVKWIAQNHRGTVRARSDGPGRGSEFLVELPLVAPHEVASSARAPGHRGPPLRILIVEDNEDAAATLAELLALGGHEVRTAATGAVGLAEVAAAAPDVLVCDIGLPDMSGHHVIGAVRASAAGRGVFAVALTGYALPQDRAQALAAGFDAHLPKPPPLAELDALLRAAAARRER